MLYQAWDAITTSKMEGVRNSYKKALAEIEGYLATAESSMSWIPTDAAQLICSLRAGYTYDPSQGNFVNEFEQKVSVVAQEMTKLYSSSGSLGSMVIMLRSRKTELERRLGYLNKLCSREDNDEKELPLSAIHF